MRPRHLARVRVPLPIVLLLSLAVVAAVWWQGTLKADFVTPPTPERLALAKAEAERSFRAAGPREDKRAGAKQAPPAAENSGEPAIELGNLETIPGLDAYAAEAPRGADHLIKLATKLEEKGAFPRALLAWERVLDLAKADDDAYATALAAVKRLRPTLPAWNIDPEDSVPLVLHAGTGPATAAQIKPVLEDVARQISTASQGILAVTVEITVGKKMPNPGGPAPAALWLSGSAKDSPGTDALSFTVDNSPALHTQVLNIVYGLVTNYLVRKTVYVPPVSLPPDENPLDALTYRVTRLCWHELGTGLNLPPPPPAPAPAPAHAETPSQKPPKPGTDSHPAPSRPKPSKPAADTPPSQPKPPKPSPAKPAR